jgi:hypothetical protein
MKTILNFQGFIKDISYQPFLIDKLNKVKLKDNILIFNNLQLGIIYKLNLEAKYNKKLTIEITNNNEQKKAN